MTTITVLCSNQWLKAYLTEQNFSHIFFRIAYKTEAVSLGNFKKRIFETRWTYFFIISDDI